MQGLEPPRVFRASQGKKKRERDGAETKGCEGGGAGEKRPIKGKKNCVAIKNRRNEGRRLTVNSRSVKIQGGKKRGRTSGLKGKKRNSS